VKKLKFTSKYIKQEVERARGCGGKRKLFKGAFLFFLEKRKVNPRIYHSGG
jgi:hypothetical protein